MHSKPFKAAFIKAGIKAGLAACTLLLASSASFAQVVDLTAKPTTVSLPDGTTVPMWGYFCNDAGSAGARCALAKGASGATVTAAWAANTVYAVGQVILDSVGNVQQVTVAGTSGSAAPAFAAVPGSTTPDSTVTWTDFGSQAQYQAAYSGTWAPPVITVPYVATGTHLTINLTNALSFAAGANKVPTSLTIVGQLGGGLGLAPTRSASPAHAPLGVTWATANTAGAASPTFTPPPQGARVQSFGTESAAGTTTALTWSNLKPGTYLLESGTHPSIQGPMGLYGIVVVTAAPTGTPATAGTAYPNVTYDTDLSLLFSEIDPVQNAQVAAAVATAGFSETAALLMRDTIASVAITNAGCGYSVGDTVNFVGGGTTSAAAATVGSVGPATGCTAGAITSVNVTNAGSQYSSAPALTVTSTGGGTGAALVAQLSLATGSPCSGGAAACYPPAVNYTPVYYLINGVAFDKTNAAASLFKASASISATPATATATGNVLVRLVNAGLRMHLPSIVGAQTMGPSASTAGSTVLANGFTLIAEDGNPLPPSAPHVQSDVFMAAGKTYDVMINGPAAASTAPALPVYDRQLSLSGNAISRDAGMLAYISVNGAGLPAAASASANAPMAVNDAYPSLIAGQTLTVSDPRKGVIANDKNVYGVQLLTPAANGSVTLNANGTFTYVPSGTATSDSFTYCANGTVTAGVCSSNVTATVSLSAAKLSSGVSVGPKTYTSHVAGMLSIKPSGVLSTPWTGCTPTTTNPCVDADAAGFPLTVAMSAANAPAPSSGLTLAMDPNGDGGFTATVGAPGTYTFTYHAQSSQGVVSSNAATVTLVFPAASNLQVTVLDGSDKKTVITDYRWVIEEDRTFYVNPATTTNTGGTSIVPTLGVNFHTSNMPFVAQGCTGPVSCEGGQMVYDPVSGTHQFAICDVGNGVCRTDPDQVTGTGFAQVLPGQVYLDPTKRYYISVLPGDAANPFAAGFGGTPDCTTPGHCGHGMGGAPITVDPYTGVQASAVTVLTQPSPYPPSKLSVFVFEDDFPLNGEQDGGGGIDVLSPQEPGLGGFQIHLWDAMGGNGDFTGQMSYDMFNQPLTNSLDGTVDPNTGLNACPITQVGMANPGTSAASGPLGPDGTQATTAGITGMIVTCPKYESDGQTLSPLAGQAVIANLMPGRFGVVATPGADRIARGEEWLQTNTLDGQKAHDSFVRIGEPSYFQEFGPASFHVTIGFANPAIINARHPYVCNGTDASVAINPPSTTPGQISYGSNCQNTIIGRVVGERLSRTPDERLYGSGSHDAFAWSQCYVSFGDPDAEDFAFTKCDADGRFTLSNLPDGSWRVTTFDQWNDQLVDGLSTPVGLGGTSSNNPTGPSNCPGPLTKIVPGGASVCDMGDIAATQWQTNLYTRTFVDDNHDGISQAAETGIPFANVAVRLRDGSLENLLVTDFTGTANFNETFPLFSWYVVETDVTRYKNTGTHVVYDVGGPADGTLSTCGGSAPGAGYPPCGKSTIAKYLANTAEQVSVPLNLRVPGAVYCAGADCTGKSIQNGPGTSDPPSVCTSANGGTSCSTQLSSGRIDPPWVGVEGWQGFPGQNSIVEFGKAPYADGENGGIHGHVVYASTRPFDDPQMLVQTQWTPLIPHVTVNLYQEGFAADGVTPTLTLVDTTQTSSWDDWAQGFHVAADGVTRIPNMNCPGQGAATGPLADLFFFSLYNQPEYLDWYNSQHGGAAATALPYNSQFKCYDGMHNWNQVQPAPYDGMYQFPSVTATDATTGKPTATNCKVCIADPAPTSGPDADLLHAGLPMLPPGKYVVEVVPPSGFELVKEEDKNILIGDDFIAPVTQQFGGLGNVFIMPDQASVTTAYTTAGVGYNPNNAQNSTQSLGASPSNSIVPAFIPEPTWPCVGAPRVVPDYISLYPQTHQVSPFAGASRRLCDRKEVTLSEKAGAIAKFYLFTSTHLASKFTGGITDDYTSEFDPFSPQFGEKFAPPDLPVSVRDWAGNETNRVYADHWGSYDGMTYSTWEVNPPNPTGYSPTMMVFCMNDPGPIMDTRPTILNGAGQSVSNPTLGQMITDPAYTTGYSQFCYELPFMPGTTQYLDTPVVPTSAFAGAGYNNVDCAYPNATPAISEVDGDTLGPWVSDVGHPITIKALGDVTVPNNAYSGPSATSAPYNQKTITRHYGFGTGQGTGSVTIGGVAATVMGWTDAQITALVPNGVPSCAIQQQSQYGGKPALCGELVITAGNGRKSVDTVTVTVGGKAPTVLALNAASTTPMTQRGPGAIQQAIDAAAPGDLIIVPPGTYYEMVLMWKPVRLQGVGGASSIINAQTQPAGKLDPWRRQVDCLFGLAIDGQPFTGNGATSKTNTNSFDPTATYSCPSSGWNYFVGTTSNNPQVDRLPLEATLGWDASLNGNMAELLQEPSLMGALEGAGVTVLSKGVDFHGQNPNDPTLLAAFPTGTTLLTMADCQTGLGGTNPNPSNFQCNPSSIDGMGITESSQGGGGIFVHGWGHNLQIANNRVHSNAGTLSGGINVGQGEFPPNYTQAGTTNAAPGSCLNDPTIAANVQLPYCHNLNVNVHNNYVSLNSSTGDELFSATPAGAGGVSFCTGSDYYQFNYNWVCGNLSSGDGGGLGHLGFSYNGDIEHNTFVFNQSINPTIPANGGGLIIMGSPDADPTCGATTDADCVSTPGSIGPSDGIGPGLKINANLIMGNAAESGTGGGIAFQNVNGSDVLSFPTTPSHWYHVQVTNNIIVNNVAGWDGAGISLLDALNVDIVNNTIASNATTASAGMLFNTLGAPLASQHGPTCTTNCGTSSAPQPAGLVSVQNSAVLSANLPATITCPAGHGPGGSGTGGLTNGACRSISYPVLANNIVYKNAAYYIQVGATSPQYQQNVVGLYNAFTGTLAASQQSTGACSPSSYWDVGVRGDTGPTNHGSGFTLAPTWSLLTSTSGYGGSNISSNPDFVSQYCDGSRQPPEAGISGWQVPAGISDATVPNPIFNLTPVATVDEGNNWVNMRWGPLTMSNPVSGAILGDYTLQPASPAVDHIPSTASTYALALLEAPTDFFGHARPDDGSIDIGAVEQGNGAAAVAPTLTSIVPNSGLRGQVVNVVINGAKLSGETAVTVSGGGITVTVTSSSPTAVTATFAISGSAAFGARNVTVTTPGGSATLAGAFTVVQPTLASIAPNSGGRGTAVNVTLTGTNLSGATAVTVSGTGVAASNVVATSPTTVTATLTITNTAGLGAHNVAVVTSAGTTNTMPFTVQAPTTSFAVSPATIRLTAGANPRSGTATITVRNTSAAGGPSLLISADNVPPGGSLTSYLFTKASDTCIGNPVAPGATCTVGVQFTQETTSGQGTTHSVNVTFTDNATGTQSVTVSGHAN